MENVVKRKLPQRKWPLIVAALFFYFSLLNVISHARGPTPYHVGDGAPLLSIADFQPLSGAEDVPQKDAFELTACANGAAFGYQALLDLSGLDRINIRFQALCPAQSAGAAMFVDLYNFEENYDYPEQEQQIILEAGLNELDFDLDPGPRAPRTAWVRLFTFDATGCQIQALQVCSETELPKVTPPMLAAAAITGAFLVAELFLHITSWRGRLRPNASKGE